MAAVSLTKEQKFKELEKKDYRETKNAIEDFHITYTEIARLLGISPQAVAQQFKKQSISRKVMNAVTVLKEG